MKNEENIKGYLIKGGEEGTGRRRRSHGCCVKLFRRLLSVYPIYPVCFTK